MIEFQKHGLLHLYMLIILADYVIIVCVEIPDTTLDSILHARLHRIVKRCMITVHVVCVLSNFLRNSMIQHFPLKMVTHYTDIETIHRL